MKNFADNARGWTAFSIGDPKANYRFSQILGHQCRYVSAQLLFSTALSINPIIEKRNLDHSVIVNGRDKIELRLAHYFDLYQIAGADQITFFRFGSCGNLR